MFSLNTYISTATDSGGICICAIDTARFLVVIEKMLQNDFASFGKQPVCVHECVCVYIYKRSRALLHDMSMQVARQQGAGGEI